MAEKRPLCTTPCISVMPSKQKLTGTGRVKLWAGRGVLSPAAPKPESGKRQKSASQPQPYASGMLTQTTNY